MIIADLHIHSRFSRACSNKINIDNLEKYARIKGLNLLGTGDFQHPSWRKEIDEKLQEEDGILYTKNRFPFLWSTEISLMYTQGKGRRIHFIVLAPNKEVVKQIIEFLGSKGRLDYDGRPIFGFNAIELVESMEKIDDKIEIIPAHAWTPYFGIFGSMSGFDSLKECFADKVDRIHAIETGMSSSPEMNWRLSELNNKTIISFSDLHSFWPWRIAREATIFSNVKSYEDIIKQIRDNEIIGTIETDPAYGKYHYDGHRLCNFSCSPEQTKKLNGICPICRKALTIGVENRVEELADQEIEANKKRKPYYKVLPLHELIAAFNNTNLLSSNKIWNIYNKLIEFFGNEFNVMLNVSYDDLAKVVDVRLAKLMINNREGKLRIKAGYDGEYGKIILEDGDKLQKQRNLSEY